MTKNKRFKYYEHKGADYILENPNEDLDFIEMLGDCLDEEKIVNRLNELYDENEQLKKENNYLSNIISAIEKGSCRSIDSFLDMYCSDELLKEFDLND